jgi:hypothetical protein
LAPSTIEMNLDEHGRLPQTVLQAAALKARAYNLLAGEPEVVLDLATSKRLVSNRAKLRNYCMFDRLKNGRDV